MTLKIGAIADDFTGATDLASMLVAAGMKTVQFIGVPGLNGAKVAEECDAVVISLKSRTIPVGDAVSESRRSLEWLHAASVEQIYFKYCSTFDSTPRGNIGPVADMLMNELDGGITVICPALPANGRTVYQGNLFVGDVRLDESGMRDHPLTPMTDANVIRLMAAQTPHKVGHVEYATVRAGSPAISARLNALRESGVRYAVVDAIVDEDLIEIGRACQELRLVTGGSGLAAGVAANFGGLRGSHSGISVQGPAAVIAGSCSQATNRQVVLMRERAPSYRVDALKAAGDPENTVRDALQWADRKLGDQPILIYATSKPDEVKAVQAALGVEKAGEVVETALSRVARGLVDRGVARLIVAGGETSGAVVRALGVDTLSIGPAIAPGVPWTFAEVEGRQLALALKSGNFGQPDFFLSAWETLP